MRIVERAARALAPAALVLTGGLLACDPGEGPADLTERPDSVLPPAIVQALANPCDSLPAPYSVVVAQGVSGGAELEHEVHDCQRLVVGPPNDRAFGPLVGIFPLDHAMDFDTTGSFESPVVVATVLSWDPDDPYTPLGMTGTWRCLWLRNDAGTWTGALADPQGRLCVLQDSVPASFPLEVHRLTRSGSTPDDYPPTARWHWDEARGEHFMGIRCGNGWCVAGNPGFTHDLDLNGPILTRSIPGWFDRQHLAVPDPAAPHDLRPGPRGTIYPSPELREVTGQQLVQGMIAAEIVVEGPPESPDVLVYREKFSLEPHPTEPRSVGRIELQLNPGLLTGQAWFLPGAAGTARVQAPGLIVTPHTLHAAVGAVRWRWLGEDEGPWISCRDRCCYAQSDGEA